MAYTHLSALSTHTCHAECPSFNAALMDEACAVAPEDQDVREENKDARGDNVASSAQDLDLSY